MPVFGRFSPFWEPYATRNATRQHGAFSHIKSGYWTKITSSRFLILLRAQAEIYHIKAIAESTVAFTLGTAHHLHKNLSSVPSWLIPPPA